MNWPESLDPMPAAVREYRENRIGFPSIERAIADAAIEALKKKLVNSIEWGRIEQKRKQGAEEREHDAIVRAEKAEARAKALECCGNCGHSKRLLHIRGSRFICDIPWEGRELNPGEDNSCHFMPSLWEGRTG